VIAPPSLAVPWVSDACPARGKASGVSGEPRSYVERPRDGGDSGQRQSKEDGSETLENRKSIVSGGSLRDGDAGHLSNRDWLEDAQVEADCRSIGVNPELNEAVRAAMRKVPYPVAVVTANGSDKGLAGLTVSSFNTVTIEPYPIVSFNVKLPSSTYDAIVAKKFFRVSVVWDPATAIWFSSHRSRIGGESSGGHQPLILLEKGTAFRLHCRWLQEKSVEVGDHMIIVGQVMACRTISDWPGNGYQPVAYGMGRYHMQWDSANRRSFTTYTRNEPGG
jgi:flavin reductase (DIM6/NTAB) family NADH-FMN oxidoreductase RutF